MDPESSHRVVDSVRWGWGLRICISTKFPGKADAADPRNCTLRTINMECPKAFKCGGDLRAI